jgi:small subunit ribosomal protein S4e
MASKGNRRHVKRLNTPGYFQIHRKDMKFFLNTIPGPHMKNFSLPLGHIIRDLLKLANNRSETDFILNKKKVMIDKVIRCNARYPVGLMDVIEISEINKAYRVLPHAKYGLILSEITKEEAKFKLCRIENISTLPGGHLQLNLHDGRNIKIDIDNPAKKPNIPYKTMGTLKISLPDQKILDYFPYQESAWAIIFKGKNSGKTGKVTSITRRYGLNASTAELQQTSGEKISTAYAYSFVLGKENPSIDLPLEK